MNQAKNKCEVKNLQHKCLFLLNYRVLESAKQLQQVVACAFCLFTVYNVVKPSCPWGGSECLIVICSIGPLCPHKQLLTNAHLDALLTLILQNRFAKQDVGYCSGLYMLWVHRGSTSYFGWHCGCIRLYVCPILWNTTCNFKKFATALPKFNVSGCSCAFDLCIHAEFALTNGFLYFDEQMNTIWISFSVKRVTIPHH